MPRSSLAALPTEILNHIITSLPSFQNRDTLCNLRSTCHLLNDLATPQLFHTLALQAGREDERLMTIGQKYLHHVQWLLIRSVENFTARFTEMDDIYPDCAFHYLDLVDRMPRLQRLWLQGCYSCDGASDFGHARDSSHNDDDGTERDDDADSEIDPAERATEMAMLLRQRSLLTAPEERIATSLSYLYLEIDENYSRRFWSLETFASVLLIPSMRDLLVRGKGLNISCGNAPFLPSENYYGQSPLRKLKIVDATIILPALDRLMRLPMALQKLSFRGKTLVLPVHNREPAPLGKFQRAIETQMSSLEVLEVNEGFFSIGGWRLTVALDLSGFTRMKRYKGCYQDLSGKFRALPGEDTIPETESGPKSNVGSNSESDSDSETDSSHGHDYPFFYIPDG